MGRIGIIGAGAWGTALACVVRRVGHDVVVYAHELETMDAINKDHVNRFFLPGISLDPKIKSTQNVDEVTSADAVLLVVPAQHLRETCKILSKHWKSKVPIVICTKGIEQESCALMSEIVSQVLPKIPILVLSGPTFAREVALDLPTAATLASNDESVGERLTQIFNTNHFRIYRSTDVVGAQIGGAIKNVIAIACGILEGKGFGENSKAAIIARGLAEMVRFGVAKGAKAETLSGLTGLGDLTLTCNDMQSRNFSLGVSLGRGQELDEIISKRVSVAEGIYSSYSVVSLARRINVEVPICRAVNDVVSGNVEIESVIESLLSRPIKAETE